MHVAVALCSFDGRPLAPVLTRAKTDRNHQAIAQRLGLATPFYFDPAIPTLAPPVPTRRLISPARIAVADTLSRIFTLRQPASLAALDHYLLQETPPVTRTPWRNSHGRDSWYFSSDLGQVAGGDLGQAWEPRHLQARLKFCGALREARLLLNFRKLLRDLLFIQPALEAQRLFNAFPGRQP